MDPGYLTPQQWQLIDRALVSLTVAAGLAVNTALVLLLGRGVIPSLIATDDAPAAVRGLRWVLLPLAGMSVGLMLYALARGLMLAVAVLEQISPRSLI